MKASVGEGMSFCWSGLVVALPLIKEVKYQLVNNKHGWHAYSHTALVPFECALWTGVLLPDRAQAEDGIMQQNY